MGTFQKADSEASNFIPAQASSLRKGGFVLIKDKPCKIVEMSSSKVGKHGHAKIHLVGLDVFDNKKHEINCPSGHNMNVPIYKRQELEIIQINHEGYFSLMSDNGDIKSDVKYDPDLCPQPLEDIKEMVENCQEGDTHVCVAQIITCMDKEGIKEVRKVKYNN